MNTTSIYTILATETTLPETTAMNMAAKLATFGLAGWGSVKTAFPNTASPSLADQFAVASALRTEYRDLEEAACATYWKAHNDVASQPFKNRDDQLKAVKALRSLLDYWERLRNLAKDAASTDRQIVEKAREVYADKLTA